MNKQLTVKQEILLLILTVIALGLLYYELIYSRLAEAKVQYDTTDLEAQITACSALKQQMDSMEDEIAAGKEDKSSGEVATYNNLKQEISELNDIFGDASSFNFSFDQAVATDDAVRRVISASFTADSYSDAKKMIQELYEGTYRCLITDISIAPADRDSGDDGSLSEGPVSVTLNVTFFETLYNAPSKDGLIIENDNSGTDTTTIADELQSDKERAESTGENY